jgi:hypothetical protein
MRPTPNLDLIARAYTVIARVPKERFTLQHVHLCEAGIDCGDASYWLSQDAFFKSLGLSCEREGGIYFNGQYMGGRLSLAALLGLEVAMSLILFGERRASEQGPWSDKDACLQRISGYLYEHHRPVPKVPHQELYA